MDSSDGPREDPRDAREESTREGQSPGGSARDRRDDLLDRPERLRTSDPDRPAEPAGEPRGGGRGGSALDDLLPAADVDSRWWWWVAAVPAHFAVTMVAGLLVAFVFFAGVLLDVGGAMGLGTGFAVLAAAFIGLFVVALPGLVLMVLFPLGIYVDARAVSRSSVAWNPDPVLYGLVALAAVLTTTYLLSVPLALYYLYRRHEAVGTP